VKNAGRSRRRFFLAGALTIFWASIIWTSGVRASAVTLDDSGSQAVEPSVTMRWKTAGPSRSAADNVMVGTMTVRVRINVSPSPKRSRRIYLTLPAQPPGRIDLTWTTQGRLLPGQLASGNRVLVYAGPITAPVIEDTVTFKFSVAGTLLGRAVQVSYHFEMDEG